MTADRTLQLKLAGVLGLTALFLGIALYGVDLEAAVQAVRGFSWPMLVPMVCCYLASHALRSWRLQLLLHGEGAAPAYGRVFALNTVGFLAINVVPLRLGEMVRPYLLWEREGVPLGQALAAIVLERLLDLVMLLVMLVGVGFVVDLPPGGLVVEGIDLVSAGQRAVGGAVLVGILGAATVTIGGPAVLAWVRRLPFGGPVAALAGRFRGGLVALARRPLRLLLLVCISAGIWGLTLGGVGSVMAGFSGLPLSLDSVWLTWTATITGMTLIPTPGFFGAYELFCSRALWLFGVGTDLASAFAVTLHLGQFGFTLVLGGIFVVLEGLSLRDLVRPPERGGVDGTAVDAEAEVEVGTGGPTAVATGEHELP